MPAPTIVPLLPTRALKARLAVNHALPGVVLLATGVASLVGHDARWPWLPWLEIASGGAVLVAIAWELKSYDPHHHAAVGWVEVFAGLMLMVEAVEHLKFTKIFQPALLYFAAGVITIAMAFNASRRSGRQSLRLDERGLSMRLSLRRRSKAPWSQVGHVRHEPGALVLGLSDGREQCIDLHPIANHEQVVAAVREHVERLGIRFGPAPVAADAAPVAAAAVASGPGPDSAVRPTPARGSSADGSPAPDATPDAPGA